MSINKNPANVGLDYCMGTVSPIKYPPPPPPDEVVVIPPPIKINKKKTTVITQQVRTIFFSNLVLQ